MNREPKLVLADTLGALIVGLGIAAVCVLDAFTGVVSSGIIENVFSQALWRYTKAAGDCQFEFFIHALHADGVDHHGDLAHLVLSIW